MPDPDERAEEAARRAEEAAERAEKAADAAAEALTERIDSHRGGQGGGGSTEK